jgi:hypothetical protein
VVTLPLLLVGIGAVRLTWQAFVSHGEAKRRAARQTVAAEARRLRECGEVVRFFANHVGHVARTAVGREELEQTIDAGATPNQLADQLARRCADTDGVLLGHQLVAGTSVPVVLPETLRSRHVYMVGRSGAGKTTLIRNLIRQDLEAGHGLAVIAPEAELIHEELLPHIPRSRWDDVVVVDPADTDHPVALNPLHLAEGEDLDLKAAETLSVLQRLFDDDSTGSAPRLETILRQALYALMQVPGSTLLDLERLLDRGDESFRVQVIGQLRDEDARRFWSSTYPAYPKDAHLAVVNRLGRLLRPRVVRSLLCAPGGLDVRRAMDEGRVLLFALSDGLLGEQNAQLLGQLVVAKIQLAAMSRADLPKEERRPFYLYIDEFQSFCSTAATSYAAILSRARKYNLGLILAHQQTGQIPEGLMREILGNVSTVVSFSVGATDARRLARELIGEIDGQPAPVAPQELLSLRIGEAVCRIGRTVMRVATPPAPERGEAHARAEILRRSRERYTVPTNRPRADRASAQAGGAPDLDGLDPRQVFGA